MVTDELLTIKQVAERLGFNPKTVWRMLRGGSLHGVRPTGPSGSWRIPASEVERVSRDGDGDL